MNLRTWTLSNLRLEIKHLKDEVAAFKSGKKYVQMEKRHREELNYQDAKIRNLKKLLGATRKEVERVRTMWMQTCDDVREECDREKARMQKLVDKAEKERDEARRERDAAKSDMRKAKKEAYQAKAEHEETLEKNKALTARIKKDYTNSSKPSSMDPNHKTIANSREKSGRKPGGQPGHKHHPRKQYPVNETHECEMPEKYKNRLDYHPTGKIIRKQMVFLKVSSYVVEYTTPELIDLWTRKKTHAPFPKGYINEVNYDASVKGFAYMLNNACNVSIDRVRTFIKDISGGDISISTGMICNLSREFSRKTEEERNKLFLEHLAANVLHADFTFARKQGKQTAAMITATENSVLYQAKAKKGDEGVKGTPVEHYTGTLITDHESALAKHGTRHQECISHVRRYTISSIQNEHRMKWNRRMRRWIRKAIKHWHSFQADKPDVWTDNSNSLIQELRDILEKALKEYEYVPPSRYFKDGFNLCKRMSESLDEYVLFLRDHTVPPTNNRAERCARKYKRKAHQMMSFRGAHGDEYYCDGLSVIETMRMRNENIYEGIVKRFAI